MRFSSIAYAAGKIGTTGSRLLRRAAAQTAAACSPDISESRCAAARPSGVGYPVLDLRDVYIIKNGYEICLDKAHDKLLKRARCP